MGRSLTRGRAMGLWTRTRPPSAGALVSRPGSPRPSPGAGGPSSSSTQRVPGSPVSIVESGEARPEGSVPEGPAPTASPPREDSDDSQPPSVSPSWLSSRPPTASPAVDASLLRQAAWGGMAAGTLLEAGLARVLFYPTLLYTLFRGRVPGRAHRDWYNRIDRTVLLGALPLRSMTRRVSRAGRPDPAGPGSRASAARASAAGSEPLLYLGSWSRTRTCAG